MKYIWKEVIISPFPCMHILQWNIYRSVIIISWSWSIWFASRILPSVQSFIWKGQMEPNMGSKCVPWVSYNILPLQRSTISRFQLFQLFCQRLPIFISTRESEPLRYSEIKQKKVNILKQRKLQIDPSHLL